MSTKNFNPSGPAVWPAIGNIYTNVLFYFIDSNVVQPSRVSNRNSVARNLAQLFTNCAELRGVYRARNCAQVKSTCVGNPKFRGSLKCIFKRDRGGGVSCNSVPINFHGVNKNFLHTRYQMNNMYLNLID